MINIKGIDKATLLAALFNNSRPLGMGFFAAKSNVQMTTEEAQKYIDAGQKYFDYLEGRVMKIDISGDEMEPRLYDRDNGVGAAARVVDTIRAAQQVAFKPAVPANSLEQAAASGDIDSAKQQADAQVSIVALR
jgi:hypothetical protein